MYLVNNKSSNCNFILFFIASEAGEFNVVDYLLKKGVDIYAKNKWDQTAIHMGIFHFTMLQNF